MSFTKRGDQLFSDQRKAIDEMIRVAKKGSKIVIMDETEKLARRLERIPGINAWFRHQHGPIVPPTMLIPPEMEQQTYRELYDGQAWYLSFRKPRLPEARRRRAEEPRSRSLDGLGVMGNG